MQTAAVTTPKAPGLSLRRAGARSAARLPLVARAVEAPPSASGEDITGLKHLSEAARERALDKKANKFEKVKTAKCGSKAWDDVYDFAKKIREGESTWEDLDLDDVDIRLKWAGLFHRRKRAPGSFMARLKIANGEMTSEMLRFCGESIQPYGEAGCADITTRANIQLRGIMLDKADELIDGTKRLGMSSFMSGMDNVRNLTSSPIAGIDPHELADVRPIMVEMQAMITNNGEGREDLSNLPRKLNICISPSRDDFPHTHINDVGFQAVKNDAGEVVYNLEIGGYFSVKRNTVSVPSDISVTADQVVPFCEGLLKAFRDNGPRGDRQKTRLMWLFEEKGVEGFRDMIREYIDFDLGRGVHVEYDDVWVRRELMGVHDQKQEGFKWVGACVPAGRVHTQDFFDAADIADKYGDGTVRLTCEENIIFPNVPEANIDAMLQEPLFQKWTTNPGPLMRGLVSCTGSQFCGFALIETKNRAVEIAEELEAQLDIPETVRMHWTGCPNSCGQAQVGELGFMGGPAKVEDPETGKKMAVEGVKIFKGGKIGEGAVLAEEFESNIPAAKETLVPHIAEILKAEYGATEKA